MLGFMTGLLGIAWRILMFTVVIEIFITIIKSGKSTARDIRDTFIMAIKVGVTKIQSWLFVKYKDQEEKKQREKAQESKAEKAEGEVK